MGAVPSPSFHSLLLSCSSLAPFGISLSVLSGCRAGGAPPAPQGCDRAGTAATVVFWGSDSGSIPSGLAGTARAEPGQSQGRASPIPGTFQGGKGALGSSRSSPAIPVVIPGTFQARGCRRSPQGKAEFSSLWCWCVSRNSSRLCCSPLPSPCCPPRAAEGH